MRATLPPTLEELITSGVEIFTEDFPILEGTLSPDGTKLVRDVIKRVITDYYYYDHISFMDTSMWTKRFNDKLYKNMLQLQYPLKEWLALNNDDQFFYNKTSDDRITNNKTTGHSETDASGTSKMMDTPQNRIDDINNYLTQANVDESKSAGDNRGTSDTETKGNVKSSVGGDLSVRFQNFLNTPSIYDVIIRSVGMMFLHIRTFDTEWPESRDELWPTD